MLDSFMRDHIETIIPDVRAFVERYRIVGRVAIEGFGVHNERMLLESLAVIMNDASDSQWDFSEWFSDNP